MLLTRGMKTITETQIHCPLFCVYDADRNLIGAFLTQSEADAFAGSGAR